MHHLCLSVAKVLDGEGDGTLNTVQVVVDAQSLQYKQRSRDTTQTQLRREVLLKEVFNQFDTLLSLLCIEQCIVVQGFNYLSHFTVDSNFACKGIVFIIHLQAKSELFSQNDTNY